MKTTFEQFEQVKNFYTDDNIVALMLSTNYFVTYKNDAVTVSRILGITLTKRTIEGETVEMAGFPIDKIDSFLPRLTRAGLRVAICEC